MTPHPPTCAVVVTYHPDAAFPARLALMAAEADLVVVVDNGSAPAALALVRGAVRASPRVRLIENGENVGLAEALNAGVRAAAAAGFGWVLTFDQDTAPLPGMLGTLFAARAAHPNPARVGLVGSMPVDAAGVRRYAPGPGAGYPVGYVVTSGSLMCLAAHAAAGPFRSDYFIDSVDREYCYRLRSRGYHVLRAGRPGMTHVWGTPVRARLGPVALLCHAHSPLRRYYMTRNWLAFMAEHGVRRPGAFVAEVPLFGADTVKAVVLEPDGRRKVIAVALGLFDACRGRMGRAGYRRLGS